MKVLLLGQYGATRWVCRYKTETAVEFRVQFREARENDGTEVVSLRWETNSAGQLLQRPYHPLVSTRNDLSRT
jgi:hypothetical protein